MKHKLLFFSLLFVALTLTACSGSSAASGWPGLSVDEKAGTAYLAYSSEIYALNLADGSLKWQFPDKADQSMTFFSSPVMTTDGQLIFGSYDHKLRSLNPQTRSINWTFAQSAGRFISEPLITETTIFAPCADESLYAIDLSGNLLWKFHTNHALWAKPAIKGSTLYLAGMDHQLYAINAADGKLIWSKELGGASVGTPAISDDGVLYIGTFGNELLALDMNSGAIKWRTPTQGWVWSSPTLNGDIILTGDISGSLYAIDRKTGKINWKIQPDGPISGSAIVEGDTIYFTTETGSLYAVDKSGKILWNKLIGGKLFTAPVQSGDKLLLAPVGAPALVFSMDFTGNQKWIFTKPEKK